MKLGAVAANVSVGITGEELAGCLNNSGAETAITLDLFAKNLYRVIAKTAVKNVILHSVFGMEKKIPLTGICPPRRFSDLMAGVGHGIGAGADVSLSDLAVLQYTSGSTGAPKAAALTHANLVASTTQSDKWMGHGDTGNGAVLCVIPFFTFSECWPVC